MIQHRSFLSIDYRQIAITSNFFKVFEVVIYNCIFLMTMQSVFHFTQYVSEIIDKGGQVDVTYANLTEEFDRVCHEILIYKLDKWGFQR